MEWLAEFNLNTGKSRTLNTYLGSVDVRFEDSCIHYTPPPHENSTEEPETRVFLMDWLADQQQIQLAFEPVYPDRPLVFRLEDSLSIPAGESGFFVTQFTIGVGLRLKANDTLLGEILPAPRKNTYWGPPNDGILAYEEQSPVHTKPADLITNTPTQTALVPVWYHNQQDEIDEVKKIITPIQELDLYRNLEGDVIFEVLELTQVEEFYQEPKPLKRPPQELEKSLTHFLDAPNKARTLFGTVKDLPRMTRLNKMFLNR